MNSLQGKVAIVTGSARGIGAEIAITLAKAGAKVIINFIHDQIAAEAVCTSIAALGGEAHAVQADVARAAEVSKLFDAAIARFEHIDILINNAGILLFKEIADISDDELERIIDINFKSVFYTLREGAAKLSDNGRVVTISSTVTRLMLPKYGAYAATKAAIEQLTRVFACEMGKRGITANCILPGPVDTELFRTGKTPGDIERMANMAALGRIGTVRDVAQVVCFLASDEARWVTGQMIGVNGGIN